MCINEKISYYSILFILLINKYSDSHFSYNIFIGMFEFSTPFIILHYTIIFIYIYIIITSIFRLIHSVIYTKYSLYLMWIIHILGKGMIKQVRQKKNGWVTIKSQLCCQSQ